MFIINASMGFSHAESSGAVVIGDHYVIVLCKAAFIFAVTRWVLSWALRLVRNTSLFRSPSASSSSSSSSTSSSDPSSQTLFGPSSSSSLHLQAKAKAKAEVNSNLRRMIRGHLHLTTFGDIAERLPESRETTRCAVCLDRLMKRDQVRELANCCHVFHRRCLDRWLDHDIHMTCPLCRAPLLSMKMMAPPPPPPSCHHHQQPSWAVERLLYLFGDDLLR